MATAHQTNVYTGLLASGTSRAEIRQELAGGHITKDQAKVLESQTKK